jgi:acyl-CoA thioester hydrolase
MERGKFRHRIQVRVRNYEIDWQGIVHNTNYLLYCEMGRAAYLQDLGLSINIDTLQGDSRIVVVRNEINYCAPARFNELINVYTRISYIRNSSFTFEGMLESADTGKRLAENISVHVWLDRESGEPAPVPDAFRGLVRDFERENLISSDPGLLT